MKEKKQINKELSILDSYNQNQKSKNDSNTLFKNYIYYTFKNKYFICFLLLVEYFEIYGAILTSVSKIFSYFFDDIYGYGGPRLGLKITNYISMLGLLSSFNPFTYYLTNLIQIKCITMTTSPLVQVCDVSNVTYGLFYSVSFLFSVIFILNHKSEKMKINLHCAKRSKHVITKSNKNDLKIFYLKNLKFFT
jgi:hypothetical protein